MNFSKIFFRCLFIFIIVVLYSNLIGILFDNKKNEENIKNFINNDSKENIKVDKAESFIAVLEIPKINLKKGLYDIKSNFNTVEKNIEIIKNSNMPDIKKGNLILAAHSGISTKSYFNKLEKLKKEDKVVIYYQNIKYVYKISDFYDIEKTGKAKIKRDYNKNTITLITCKKKEEKQIVYIGYLESKDYY